MFIWNGYYSKRVAYNNEHILIHQYNFSWLPLAWYYSITTNVFLFLVPRMSFFFIFPLFVPLTTNSRCDVSVSLCGELFGFFWLGDFFVIFVVASFNPMVYFTSFQVRRRNIRLYRCNEFNANGGIKGKNARTLKMG